MVGTLGRCVCNQREHMSGLLIMEEVDSLLSLRELSEKDRLTDRLKQTISLVGKIWVLK